MVKVDGKKHNSAQAEQVGLVRCATCRDKGSNDTKGYFGCNPPIVALRFGFDLFGGADNKPVLSLIHDCLKDCSFARVIL